jgi:2-aminoadipate transaminase
VSIAWSELLSRRAPSLHGYVQFDTSVIWNTPDVIYFGDGAPAVEQMPITRLRQAIADAWEDAGGILSYGESEGHLPLREVIAERMHARGAADVDPALVLVTCGSQQGLDLVSRALFDPGDVVIVEGPTYFGALQAFDAYEVQYRVAPVDEHGIVPDQLAQLLAREPRAKALYTVPTFQNPTGVTLPEERRRAVLALCREANVAVIEDDPYGELYFGEKPPPPLRAFDSDVVYLGTFSKIIAPALRMGWMVVPPALYPLVYNSKEATDMLSDRFTQRAVVRVTEDGWLDHRLVAAREFYHARRDCLLAALEREMPPNVRWTRPEGGFFLWVTLPDDRKAEDLLPVALRHAVGFLPGSCFYPDQTPRSGFRLSYPTLAPEVIDEGIRRLGAATREFLADGS